MGAVSEITPNGGVNEVVKDEKIDKMVNCGKVNASKDDIEDAKGNGKTELLDENDVGDKEEDNCEAMDEDGHEKDAVEQEKVEEIEVEDEAYLMDEDEKVKPKEESEDLAEDKEEKEVEEESLKKLVRKPKSVGANKDKKNNVGDMEPKTPATPANKRPQRQRKSVDRLVSTFEKAKKFVVEKGHGTALKDIPNVKYKLSRKKWDDSIKLLHLALFARPGKAGQFRANISRFSGIVWHDNEEKQKIKLKERLEKCARDKLLRFCDVLDITAVKSTTKKEDIVTKLMEFLEAPHATRDELIADKKLAKKRKRVGKKGSFASGSSSSKLSAKSQKRTKKALKNGEGKKISTSSNDDSDEEQSHDETANSTPERSDDEMSDQAESEKEMESGYESEEEKMKEKESKKSSAKKESAGKAAKKVAPQKSPLPKTSSSRPKAKEFNDKSAKGSAKRRGETIKKPSMTNKSSAQDISGETHSSLREKHTKDKQKLVPDDDELRDAISNILKEADLTKANFIDILNQLAERFNVDLTPRKSTIKLMIQEELTELADESENDEDEDEDENEDEGEDEDESEDEGEDSQGNPSTDS